jgi:hypothetical protein
LGAVKLALGPSYYTAEPSGQIALDSPKDSKKAPHPSPRQYPSARRSSVWHRPRGDVIPEIAVAAVPDSLSTLVPIATASLQSQHPTAMRQTCSAAREDEQAVSIE